MQDGAVAFTHTEVPEALEGQGVGKRLIAGALADRTREVQGRVSGTAGIPQDPGDA